MNISFIGIVNEELKNDFWGTIEKLRALGYCGIESFPAFDDAELDSVVAKLNEMGIPPFSVAVGFWDDDETIDKQLEYAKKIGAEQAVMYYGPCDKAEEPYLVAEKLNAIAEKFAPAGIKVCYHNHDHEFRADFDSKNGIEIILENTDAEKVFLQLDTAWSTYAGVNTVEFIKANASRIFSVHLKDFAELPAEGVTTRDGAKFAALGSGVVPVADIARAADEGGIKWASVEQDRLSVLSPMENLTFARLYLKETCEL